MKIFSWKFLLIVVVLLGIGFLLFGYFSSRVERPNYQVISAQGNVQIRQYPEMIIAQVSVSGERDKAISKGFKLLADYIFGNNTVQTKISMNAPVTQQNEKIAMTAPVTQQSQKIAMTAPVSQQAGDDQQWLVRFIMPSQYTLQTLPKPNNDAVKIISVPGQKKVVIRFSGYATDNNLTTQLKKLTDFVAQEKLSTQGEPEYAFYNPPWTLGFMRTNEIAFVIE